MEEYVTKALEIVKAQASVRIMSEEELTSILILYRLNDLYISISFLNLLLL